LLRLNARRVGPAQRMPLRPSGAVWQLCAPVNIGGRERVKHLRIVRLVCMAWVICDVCVTDCAHTPLISGTETIPKLGFKQAMIASDLTYPVVTPGNYTTPYATPFKSEDLQVILVPDRFRHVFYDSDLTESAGMAANASIAMEGLLISNIHPCGFIDQHAQCGAEIDYNSISSGWCNNANDSCRHQDILRV
jgi:hypothetical protein